jgi:protein-S-isoprenylcysteine O-methyltransferase Ste14
MEGIKLSTTLWVIWFAYWVFSARHRVRDTPDAPLKRESAGGRLLYQLLMTAGFLLMFWRVRLPDLGIRLWPDTPAMLVLGLTIQAVGLMFAVWARRVLGKNWSARVAIGAEQFLVFGGPYRFVRHPIYSGLVFALLGSLLVIGTGQAVLGFVLIVVSILIKIRREEAALREHFGQAYEEYARRVPGLIPLRSFLKS